MPYRSSIFSQRILLATFHLLVIVLVGLHLVVLQLPPTDTPIPNLDDPEAAWWGFWPATYLPDEIGFVIAVLFVGGIIVWWLREWHWHSNATEFVHPASAGRSTFFQYAPLHVAISHNRLLSIILLVIAVFLAVSFFIFPIAHTRWGDADILSRAIAWPDPTLRLTHSWQAPLDVWLHSQLWLALHQQAGWTDATPTYQILSPIAGFIYLGVTVALSQSGWPSVNWLTFGLLVSLGLIQLFFGYIENYSFAAAGVLLYLWLGLRLLRRKENLWLPALCLGVTMSLHPSTGILLPSLLYLGVCQASRRNTVFPIGTFAQMALPIFFMFGITTWIMERGGHGLIAWFTKDRPGGGDGRWFVPIVEVSTRWEHYTMFSWLHIRDFLNQQILVAPVVLPSLLIIMAFYWNNRKKHSESSARDLDHSTLGPSYALLLSVTQERLFLTIASIFYLGLTFVWNPDYGGQRDWDLFSLAALPTTLLLAWHLPSVFSLLRYLIAAALPLLLFQILHTLTWVYQNTLPWAWPE
ncbi:MAG: hypothetical protein AAF702_15480 [Chloroflexota bacterium]